MEYSDAVKLTAEILCKRACAIGERTNEMKTLDMTETEREGGTVKDGQEVGGPLHEPKKETVAPKRLLAKQKRRVQTRSVKKKAQQQRKRR